MTGQTQRDPAVPNHAALQNNASVPKRLVQKVSDNVPAEPGNGRGKDLGSSDGRGVPRSRMGGLWIASVVFAFVLLLLLIFVLENGQTAEVSFFGAHGHLPMGVALLLAAVFGVLLVALPGTARIVQLRLLGHRHHPHAARTQVGAQQADAPQAETPRPPARDDAPARVPPTSGPSHQNG